GRRTAPAVRRSGLAVEPAAEGRSSDPTPDRVDHGGPWPGAHPRRRSERGKGLVGGRAPRNRVLEAGAPTQTGGDALRGHAGAGDVPGERPDLQPRQTAHEMDGRARPATVAGENGQPGDDADGMGATEVLQERLRADVKAVPGGGASGV